MLLSSILKDFGLNLEGAFGLYPVIPATMSCLFKDNGLQGITYGNEQVAFIAGQGGDTPRPAKVDFCGKAIGRWPHLGRLQHSEGVDSSPCLEAQGRNDDQGEDAYWEGNRDRH